MPDALSPSEFGGKVQKNRVQPPVRPDGKPGHSPTPSEQLMLVYTTGTEDGAALPDDGEAFNGVLPLNEQIVLQKKRGPVGC